MTFRKLLAAVLVAGGLIIGAGATPAQAIKLPLVPALGDIALSHTGEVSLNPIPEPPNIVAMGMRVVAGEIFQAGPQPEPPTVVGLVIGPLAETPDCCFPY